MFGAAEMKFPARCLGSRRLWSYTMNFIKLARCNEVVIMHGCQCVEAILPSKKNIGRSRLGHDLKWRAGLLSNIGSILAYSCSRTLLFYYNIIRFTNKMRNDYGKQIIERS